MDFLWDKITEWLKEMLIGGIVSNLSGMFDATNQKVAEISGQVGLSPQAWNGSIFSMIQNLSETVIVPIAGAILAFVMTLELIQLITDKNNLNDMDTWIFFKWAFKSAAAVLIVTNTCSSKKVTDHHAIVPTISAEKVDMASLPLGEREVLKLAARGLLRAVDEPHRYAETVITVECAGQSFTAKGKTVLAPGWKRYEQEQAEAAPALPVVTENQTLSVSAASVKTGKTTPPKHFTEDTLLAAMENAGKEDMPDDAERKGIGTPATRSGIIEKLVSSGFVERRKSKKITNLLPTSTGTALITVLPEQLQSPQLTAEWEHRLKEIERGEILPDSFMDGIAAMLHELVQTYKPIPGAEVLFPSGREVVGKCPRCGAEVTELQKGFFCENRACSFVLWKNSRFFTAKKKALTKSLAAALLKNGRAPLKGCYSEKTGKTYDAVVLLEDDGQRTGYKLVFDNG